MPDGAACYTAAMPCWPVEDFLFNLGMCNGRIARIEKNEVTHWLWKQWKEC